MIKLNIGEKSLLMRKRLTPIKEEIVNKIKSSPSGTVFYYDFEEIDGINTSGVDELIAKVVNYLISSEVDKFLILKNLKEELYEHRFNIDYSLSRLEFGIVEMMPSGEAKFLGKISDTYKEILDQIYRDKNVTARSIADLTGKKLPLVSTHLNKLYSLRLINRKEELLIEGGRQYIYQSLF
ncbi:hypothetical protein [Siminovitchia fordii]|uniref:Uncharacterized protein n=1 Tax=Siminovitchia fordii TaxID=254759 RepID=A0ABQ4KCD5_9BACI|nr:hypothetical protein [Siminovitchia fordii]GIN23393.1 hypothetical protein J1TS3_45270 [Siminovitchia fordii]